MNGINRVNTRKRELAKRLRNSGEEYVSSSTNRVISKRTPGPECKCKQKCYDRLGGIERVSQIFKFFWNIGNYNEQNNYLQKLVKSQSVKRSRKKGDSRRNTTLLYHVICDGTMIPLCQKAFLSIHGIGEKRMRIAVRKQCEEGELQKDQRGKKPPVDKLDDRQKEVKQIIENLASHYSRTEASHSLFGSVYLELDEAVFPSD